MSDDNETPEKKAGPINPGRRRLLGMIAYVPPIVIGAITLEQAGCQPSGSCTPVGGCPPSGGPCVPNGMGCNPNNCPPGIAPPSTPADETPPTDPVTGS